MLMTYPWPGNIRELASVIDRAAILGDGQRLEVAKALGTATGPTAVSPSAGLLCSKATARRCRPAEFCRWTPWCGSTSRPRSDGHFRPRGRSARRGPVAPNQSPHAPRPHAEAGHRLDGVPREVSTAGED